MRYDTTIERATISKQKGSGMKRVTIAIAQLKIPPNISGLNLSIPPETNVPNPYKAMISASVTIQDNLPILAEIRIIIRVTKNPYQR